MPELAEILAVVLLTLGAFSAGATWARRRAGVSLTAERASLAAEIESRERAEREAEDAHRVRSEILANVSHELRTPMTGVLGMADLLLTTELPAARRRQALEVIRTSAEGQLVLIDDLLDFSKIEAGKLSLRYADFRLRDLLRKVVSLVEQPAANKGLKLRLEVADELPDDLHGDPARLRQVLLNLAGNAVKFTTQGEVVLRVVPGRAAGDPEDAAAPGDRGLDLRFAVRDTGIGISPADQARIFAPFAQAESSAAREFGGTGLGLMICKNLVELMDGEIGFESTREVGSTFWFRVPVARARQGAAAFDTPAPLRRPRPVAADAPRVLVVDDNAVNRLVVESLLEALGLRTASAVSGQQALEILAGERFDAILMDCQMPRLDGYETARRLRRREEGLGRRSVVIGLTAHAGNEARGAALAAGMDDYLAKPFRGEELGAVLEPWLPLDALRPDGAATVDAASESGPLESVRRLEHAAGKDLLARTAKAFRREGKRDLETMRRALAEGDALALAQGAHALDGSSGVLKASALSELCGELEELARDGDLAGCKARLPAIEKEFDRIANEFE